MSDSGTRREHDVENTRQQILDAAREVFVASGYESTSIREVARRAGISHGTIYLHFRDKDDLLYQVSEDEFSKLLGRLRSLPRAQDPIQRLAGALKVFGTYGLDFPHQYQLMMGYRPASFSAGDTPRFGAMAEQVSAFLGDLIREARKRSIVSGDAATLDHLSLIAIVHGTVDMFFLQLVSRDAAEAALDHSIALMLGAMTDDGCTLEYTEGEGNGA
jgi:AcrR family transcriptional regulator